MRTTLARDDELVAKAAQYTGIRSGSSICAHDRLISR
jgi:Bacterial antitoxin of type II TA system, VapB